MTLRANINTKFFLRYVLIGIVCLFWAFYCLYDGFIGYPNQIIRATALEKIKKENPEREWDDLWEAMATENSWSIEDPGTSKTHADIVGQFVMAGVSAPIGLIGLFLFLRSRGRWIEADATGLTSNWGQSFEFEQILELSKKKWRDKGIAKIRYQDGNRKRRFVLDDCKFDRPATEKILRLVESNISEDQIIHGRPEPPFEPSEPESNPENKLTAEEPAS